MWVIIGRLHWTNLLLTLITTLATSATCLTGSDSTRNIDISILKCPRSCECSHDFEIVNCENQNGLEFGHLAPVIRELGLKRIHVPPDLSEATNLRRLSVTKSDITNLTSLNLIAGGKKSQLERLDLGDNRLKHLKAELFYKLPGLRFLNLTSNLLTILPENVARSLENVEELQLADNRLNVLPFRVFEPIRNLRRLDASGNLLAILQDYSFQFNKALQELVLSSNRLIKIPSRLFDGLYNLKILKINDNAITQLPSKLFHGLENLEFLDLSGNPIRNLTDATFRGLPNLRWLSLSRTQISALPRKVWAPVTNLRHLHLSDTSIEVLKDGDLRLLRRLESLEISNSPLREIESHALDATPMLKSVNLRENQLVFLPASIAVLNNLRYLELQGNPWACDCRMFWFIKWAEEREYSRAFDTGLRCGHETTAIGTIEALNYLNCTPPYIVRPSDRYMSVIRSQVVLDCEFAGNPLPSLTWVTPELKIFHWSPDPSFPDAFHKHPRVHRFRVPQSEFVDDGRVRLLENGSLFISYFLREDVGIYNCYAINPIANATHQIYLRMDPVTYHNIKIISLLVGIASAIGCLVLTFIFQMIWCLCVR